MTQIEHTITELAVSYVYSEASEELKIRLLTDIASSMEEEFYVIKKLIDLRNRSGQWPTFEYVVSSFGFIGNLQQVKEDLSLADLLDAIDKMREDEKKTEVSTILMDVTKNIQKMKPDEILLKLNDAITKVEVKREEHGEDYDPEKDYEEDASQPAGLLTFINPIDEALGGVRKGQMLTNGAFVGSFKTTEAVNLTHGNVVKTGQNGVILSLEMPKKYLHYMMLSRHSFSPEMQQYGDPVESKKIIRTLLDEEEKKFVFGPVKEDLNQSEHGRFRILDRTDFKRLDFPGILAVLSKLPFQIDFLVVDYAQRFKYLAEASNYGGGAEAANRFIDFFLSLAIGSLGYPISVVMLAQTNRNGKSRADANGGKYDIDALAELNALDRDSAYIMFQYKDANLLESNELKVNLPKNRFGGVIEEPVTTYVDPRYCVIGDEIEGISDAGVSENFSDILFGGGNPFG